MIVTVLRPLTSLQFQFHHVDMGLLKLSLIFLSFMAYAKQPAKLPITIKNSIRILEATGKIEDLSQSAKTLSWNMRSKVTDRLALKLGAGAQTKIQMSPQVVLTAYEQTEFEIPFINWDTRQFKEIKLIKGALRFEVEKGTFPFFLTTAFFQVELPEGEWVFVMDQEKALSDVISLKGNLELTSLNSEDKANIKTGEKVTFRGLLEEGEISYDLLLRGRKVPKGRWSEVQKISMADNKAYSIEEERVKKAQEQKQKAIALKQQRKAKSSGSCTKPSGDFDECYWKKENNLCLRFRCAADGSWKDEQVVAPQFCDKSAGWSKSAKQCDY